MNVKVLLLSTAAALAAPFAASAIPLTDGSYGFISALFDSDAVLTSGNDVTYSFDPDQNLEISFGFVVTGAAPDLDSISFGLEGSSTPFTEFGTLFNVIPGAFGELTLTTDEAFTVGFFDEGILWPVGTHLIFSASAVPLGEEPAPVPVPAAGLLLLGALGTLGGRAALRRRGKSA